MLYSYLALVAAGFLGYRGVAPVLVIVAIGAVMALPVISKERGAAAVSLTGALSMANAALFVGLSYGIGRGIAWMLST